MVELTERNSETSSIAKVVLKVLGPIDGKCVRPGEGIVLGVDDGANDRGVLGEFVGLIDDA